MGWSSFLQGSKFSFLQGHICLSSILSLLPTRSRGSHLPTPFEWLLALQDMSAKHKVRRPEDKAYRVTSDLICVHANNTSGVFYLPFVTEEMIAIFRYQ
jgi:hypothetical protein